MKKNDFGQSQCEKNILHAIIQKQIRKYKYF